MPGLFLERLSLESSLFVPWSLSFENTSQRNWTRWLVFSIVLFLFDCPVTGRVTTSKHFTCKIDIFFGYCSGKTSLQSCKLFESFSRTWPCLETGSAREDIVHLQNELLDKLQMVTAEAGQPDSNSHAMPCHGI